MLKIRNYENTSPLLDEKTAVEWHEITGKEFGIQTREKEGTHTINLEVKQEGRKTPKILLPLVTVVIPETVTAKYAEEPNLEQTIYVFAIEHYQEVIDTVSLLLTAAMEGNRVVDLTGVKRPHIAFSVKVERDANDKILSEDVVATLGNAETPTHIYSNAGVFDPI